MSFIYQPPSGDQHRLPKEKLVMALEKLPTSAEEVRSLAMVTVIAGLACFARVLYGKDEMRWRYTVGSILVAMVTSMCVYGFLVQWFGLIGGHASAAIGAAVGLFTDDVLRRAREWMKNQKLPGEK